MPRKRLGELRNEFRLQLHQDTTSTITEAQPDPKRAPMLRSTLLTSEDFAPDEGLLASELSIRRRCLVAKKLTTSRERGGVFTTVRLPNGCRHAASILPGGVRRSAGAAPRPRQA
jgi:hypothetical protein